MANSKSTQQYTSNKHYQKNT